MYQEHRNYDRDSNAIPCKYVRTVEDKVEEVLMVENFKSRLFTYTKYINNFVKVRFVRKDIAF